MREVFAVVKKELSRFWLDKKLLFNTLILPGVGIFLIYSLLGSVFSNQTEETQTTPSTVHVSALPDAYEALFDDDLFAFEPYLNEDPKTLIDESRGAVLIFDADFSEKIAADAFPQVALYYNATNEQSALAGNRVNAVLNGIRSDVLADNFTPEERFVFNQAGTVYQDEADILLTVISSIVPLLIIIFIFAGALSIGPDIIAGEKERGTLATLLVTPVSRGAFALGKILAITIVSLGSAFSSFIGVALALPRLLQLEQTGQVSVLDLYGIEGFIALLIIIVSTTLFIVGIISVVSAYAKSIKEATSLASPLYLITIVISALNIFSEGSDNLWLDAIPLYGSIQVINGILTLNYTWASVAMVAGSSVLWTLILVAIVRTMLSSERIVFQS